MPPTRASRTPMPKATPSILLSSGQAGPLRPSESCEHASLWTSSMLLAASAALLRSPAFPQPPRHCHALPAYLCAQGCPTELDGHGCEGSDFPFEIARDQFYQLNESAVPDGIHPRALKELAGVTAGSPLNHLPTVLAAWGGSCWLEARQPYPNLQEQLALSGKLQPC